MGKRVGGIITFKVDGTRYSAKGDFTYGLGTPKREAVIGTGDIAGYKETPQVSFIEGAITDSAEIKTIDLANVVDATVVLNLANGKSVVLREAYFAGDAQGTTGEGEFAIRFESPYPADEVQ